MTMLLLDRPFEEARLGAVDSLDLRNVGPKVWPTVLSACRSSDLRLYNITLPSLEGIERLEHVNRLTLEWATKIYDAMPVFKLNGLTSLSIYDFSKLRKIDGIESLGNLVELNLSGSRGALTPRLKLASIGPVIRLRALTSLTLSNIQLDDDDIAILARCTNLKNLSISNQFERSQFAYLAKHLNVQLMEPLLACLETRQECEACGDRKFMFAGRRMPILCKSCDSERFESHASEFEKLMRDA